MARPYNSSYLDYLSLPNPHLFFFVLIVFFVSGLSWYINFESVFEDMVSQLKLVLIFSPLILLLLVHLLSGDLPFLAPWPQQDSIHRAGASPWGVALLLVLLLFMVSYQSYFHERWFPLVTK